MTAAGTVPHLLFSTRSRNPTGGAESVREVIAASPGVGEAARREFAARADLGGSVLHAELDGPVFTFSPVGDGTFLLCRAVSLGRYRKGAHQFLVQGLLLSRQHLAWLDGNPLVLARGEVSGAHGIDWVEEHPGEGATLEPLALDPAIAARAAAFDRDRFDELAAAPPEGDPALPAALGALGRGERVACVARRPAAAWVEWVLLHLHPLDRPQVSFHTWYSHVRTVSYRLMLTTDQEASRVRGQFHGLRMVELSAPAGDAAGDAARALRQASPRRYREALAEFHLTRLADRPLPPLAEADAVLCLRDAAGAALTPEERARVDRLRLRAEPAARLQYAIEDLAAAWRGGGDFAAASRAMATALEIEPSAVEAVSTRLGRPEVAGRAEDPAERLALLALLDAAAGERPRLAGQRAPTWRRLVARGTLPALLAALADRAEDAAAVLEPYVLAVAGAEADAAAADAAPAPAGPPGEPEWAVYLAWRADRRLPPGGLAAGIERLAATQPPLHAAAWLRRLGEVQAHAGRPTEAMRLWLRGECRRLPEPARQQRVESVIAWALEESVPGVEDYLQDPELGEAVPAAVAAWAAGHPDPAAAWGRLSALLRGWRIDDAAAPGFAALVARLAASPLAARVPEVVELVLERMPGRGFDEGSDRRFLGRVLADAVPRLVARAEAGGPPELWRCLVTGTWKLIEVRLRLTGGEPASADGPLLQLTRRAIVLAEALADRGAEVAPFRAAWTSWLPSVLHWEAGTPRLDAAGEDDWIDLLAGDLRRHPPLAGDDERCRFLLTLAWRRWAAEPDTLRRLRLRRALAVAKMDAGDPWHRKLLDRAVPPALRREAEALAGSAAGLPRAPHGDTLFARGAR